MCSTKKPRLLVLLLLLPLAQACAGSPVWQIEKEGSRLYLGGSIHYLGESDYPLPAAFESAYQRSHVVAFETDIEAMQTADGSRRILERLSYSTGGSLRQDISASTYASLRDFFARRGMPMAQVDQFRPGMVSVMIAVAELQHLGLAGEGVDVFFDRRARADGRQRLQLESLDRQIDFLAGMGAGREDELLNYTLREARNIGNLMAAMKKAWREGNLDELERIIVQPMAQDFPGIYQDLLPRRNREWLPRLEKMLQDETIELVIVGAAHLVGRDGLLTMLRQRGYRIEQLP